MEVITAAALTTSAASTWWARKHWGHQIINPVLIYLGSALTGFAAYRWAAVILNFNDLTLTLWFITFVQAGIILVMRAGKQFHEQAEQRMAQWAEQQRRQLEQWNDNPHIE